MRTHAHSHMRAHACTHIQAHTQTTHHDNREHIESYCKLRGGQLVGHDKAEAQHPRQLPPVLRNEPCVTQKRIVIV